MAKIYGLFGSMTGKVADVVMSVRNGEQIARKYQPIVLNPSTPAQVEARAKLKLLSQLSAIMAPSIAFIKTGAVTARNKFLKANYGTASYSSDQATIDLQSVKLTESVVSLPSITADWANNFLTVGLTSALTDVNRVLYFVFLKQGTEIRYVSSLLANAAGDSGLFQANYGIGDDEYYVYAYGVRDNTEAARVKFSNLVSPTAETVAKIIVTSLLGTADVTVTETRVAHHTPSA